MKRQANSPIGLTAEGDTGISIYYGQPPANDNDFNSVKMILQSNYAWLRDNTSDNNIFWTMLKASIVRAGMSTKRLKDAAMYCIMNVDHIKIKDIVQYDPKITLLSYSTVQDLPEGHRAVGTITLPNGNFGFVWEDEANEVGMNVKHYETPAEKEAKERVCLTPEEREENQRKFDELLKKLSEHVTTKRNAVRND